MKRSEMIEIIANFLIGTNREYVLIEWAIEDAQSLLNLIEKEGMLPPYALIPIPENENPLVPGDFKNDNGVWCTPKPKPTYFIRQDLELVLEFDRLLEAELIQLQKDINLKNTLRRLVTKNTKPFKFSKKVKKQFLKSLIKEIEASRNK